MQRSGGLSLMWNRVDLKLSSKDVKNVSRACQGTVE